MRRVPGASRSATRSALLALAGATIAALALAQAPEEKPAPCPPPPAPPSLPSVGVALEVQPHEGRPGTYEARATLTDAVTGRRLSQSWVAVKVGSFADMRAQVTPESGGGVPVDMYMKVSIGEDEGHATLTTSYRKASRLILTQETTLALGHPAGPDR